MKKDWKYIAYLAIAVGIYLTIKLLSPREFNWRITFHHEDKNPYGAYALGQLIDNLFPVVEHSNYTLYELYDSLDGKANFLSISSTFIPGEEDVKTLLKNLDKGGVAFISAKDFYGLFADTLSINTYDVLFNPAFNLNLGDSTELHFSNPTIRNQKKYAFPYKNLHTYFDEIDSARTSIVAVNEHDLPVTIRIQWGKGALYLNSTPMAFTNFHLLSGDNYGFVETSLSHLPKRPLVHSEFYHLGRMEARTPLRFILSNEPLRWAYYLTVLSILLFMFFEAKRKQRIIPIIKPLANTTLDFISTIANLYLQRKDYKNIAEKKIVFFLDSIKSNYLLDLFHPTDMLIHALSRKSGNEVEKVIALFKQIENIQNKTSITESELITLSKSIEKFNRQ